MNKISISPKALQDLKDIREYISIELCNEKAAQNTVNKIVQSIKRLETFPQMGSPLESKINIPNDYRTLVTDNYLTFYRIDNDEIFVVRILYGGRNYFRLLFDDLFNN